MGKVGIFIVASDKMDEGEFKVQINTAKSRSSKNAHLITLDLFFWLMFHGLYHGKSPLNHHLRDMVLFHATTLRKSTISAEIYLPDICC